jgi:F-type H+-transporting ATPase subunit a
MNLGESLLKALEFETAFTIQIGGLTLPVTETVVVSWLVMAILIVGSAVLTFRLKEIPTGSQVFLEAAIEFLDNFSKENFGKHWRRFGPYIGTVFLFLLTANMIAVISPIGGFGFVPPFEIKPPTRDINVTAAFALLSILLVLASGLAARGPLGWFKHLFHPTPIMLPFNILEYLIRPLSLCLRLFGNILGAFIIMRLIEAVMPIGVPPVLSLYFDFLDGLIQALVFTFLTSLFVAEAIEHH